MTDANTMRRYLFISGPSRSGTAMLRSAVNQSPRVSLAGETHYFDDLRLRYLDRPLADLDATERAECCDYFRVQTVRPYGKGGDPEDSWLDRDSLLREAEALEARTPRATGTDNIFLAYCGLVAARDGADIGGEKTPRHVLRIDDILDLLPEAKVLCMVRDPRAVVASYRDWKYRGGLPVDDNDDYKAAVAKDEARSQKSYHIVIATMMWMAAVGAARKAVQRYGADRVRIVKYEDVVADPETVLRPVCDWLDIPFDKTLLEIPLHNSSSADFTAKAGVSTAPQHRWKTVLSSQEIGVIEWVARRIMPLYGYAPATTGNSILAVARAYATLPVAVIRAARANRDRYTSLPDYVFRRLRAATGR